MIAIHYAAATVRAIGFLYAAALGVAVVVGEISLWRDRRR